MDRMSKLEKKSVCVCMCVHGNGNRLSEHKKKRTVYETAKENGHGVE